ncbi:MAG: glycosyltransferase [Clostridiales bacterium]|nr:glycosyltransferase [Clostridiales bacterium]
MLVLNLWFRTGGTENAMIGMCRELQKHGCDVTVLSFFDEGDNRERMPEGVKLRLMERSFLQDAMLRHYSKNGLVRAVQKVIHKSSQIIFRVNGEGNRLFESVLKLTPCLPDEEYDLLLDFYGYGNFLTAFGDRKVRAKRKATWVHVENMDYFRRTRGYYGGYDRIFCVSNAVKDAFDKEFPDFAEKTEVFHNYIDTERIQSLASQSTQDMFDPGKGFNIVTVCRLNREKGIDIAIGAAAILKKTGCVFKWVIIGEGEERQTLESLIRENDIGDCFCLAGNRTNPYPYIKNCSIYVQPSRNEGYSTTILEARVLGKVIVTSNIPSSIEQINDGINGYICELDPESFASRISRLMDNRERISKMECTIAGSNDYSFDDYKLIVNMIDSQPARS